jgi:hypothetical protein
MVIPKTSTSTRPHRFAFTLPPRLVSDFRTPQIIEPQTKTILLRLAQTSTNSPASPYYTNTVEGIRTYTTTRISALELTFLIGGLLIVGVVLVIVALSLRDNSCPSRVCSTESFSPFVDQVRCHSHSDLILPRSWNFSRWVTNTRLNRVGKFSTLKDMRSTRNCQRGSSYGYGAMEHAERGDISSAMGLGLQREVEDEWVRLDENIIQVANTPSWGSAAVSGRRRSNSRPVKQLTAASFTD